MEHAADSTTTNVTIGREQIKMLQACIRLHLTQNKVKVTTDLLLALLTLLDIICRGRG